VRTLRTRLASRDLVAVLQTLRLSEMLIKNCGMRFAQVAASHKPFVQQLEQTAVVSGGVCDLIVSALSELVCMQLRVSFAG
jgi:hypothetical protein